MNRGPQSVQLVAQYPWNRLPGSAMSLRHAAQVATSGGIVPLPPPPSRDDPEPVAPVGGEVRLLQAFDHGEGGRRTAERGGEPGNGGWIPLNLDLHPSVPQVAHMPGQALADRGAVHERAESHPLDGPRDVDPLPHALGHRGTSIDVATPSVPPRADDGGWTGGG